VRWAVSAGRDLTVLCAGEKGGFSLEDAVCAGLVAEGIARAAAGVTLSDAAQAARCLGVLYGARLDRLRSDSGWARHLEAGARGADLDCCLRLDTSAAVPVLGNGAITAGPGALTWPAGTADTRPGRLASPGENR
jgi:2-phosphosulfolactate phosphatase